jgi:photosystem II stability/assembly factor-like uncharacterized protein
LNAVFGNAVLGLYALGDKGAILYRKKAGAPWQRQVSGVTANLRSGIEVSRSLQFVQYVVGDDGTLLVHE